MACHAQQSVLSISVSKFPAHLPLQQVALVQTPQAVRLVAGALAELLPAGAQLDELRLHLWLIYYCFIYLFIARVLTLLQ